MPSRKITEMTAAMAAKPADVFPIVQDGLNKKQTRNVFMTAEAGDEIGLYAASSSRTISNTGRLEDLMDQDHGWYLWDGVATYVEVVPTSGTYIFQYGAHPILIQQDGGGAVQLNETNLIVQFGNSSINISSGGMEIIVDAGQSIACVGNDGSGMVYDFSTLALYFQGASGITVRVGSDTDYVTFLSGGGIAFNLSAGIAITIPFQTANTADWDVATPGTYEDALNRIAAWLNVKFGGPIP